MPSKDESVIFQRVSRLYVLRLPSGETTLLTENGRNPSWSPTGHVILDREGSIWALPFSLKSLEPSGEAFLVEPGFASGGVSKDGTLLCVTSPIISDRSQLTIRDRQGKLIDKVGPPLFRAQNPAVSTDGKKVAVSASRQPEVSNDIWIFDVEGRGRLRLTTDPRSDDGPIWTVDGRRILFRTSSDRSTEADFFVADAEGGSPIETFLDNDLRVAEPAFSPDGGILIYQQRPLDATQFGIWFVENPKPGGRAEPVAWLDSRFNEAHAQFSPDGKYVAYSSGESGTLQIHIRPFPAGSPVWQVSLEGGQAPRWSPDGRELYWWGAAGDFPLMAAEIDFTGSNPVGDAEVLFPTRRNTATFLYDVMPGGRFVIVESIEEDDSQTSPPIHMRVTQNWYEEFRGREQD